MVPQLIQFDPWPNFRVLKDGISVERTLAQRPRIYGFLNHNRHGPEGEDSAPDI